MISTPETPHVAEGQPEGHFDLLYGHPVVTCSVEMEGFGSYPTFSLLDDVGCSAY